jgi:hypothetical protein
VFKDRFELRSTTPGFWSVIDRRTNQPASYRNCLMIRLGLDEADAFAELLNENWRRTHWAAREIHPSSTGSACHV